MFFFILSLVAGAGLLAVALLLRRLNPAPYRFAPWALTGAGGFVLGVGCTYGLSLLLFAGEPRPDPSPPAPMPVPPRPPPDLAPLAPGTRLPPLTSQWLNGPPAQRLLPANHGVVVVDIWAYWCPVCRQEAPGLVRTYQQYKDRGVTFISITSDTKDRAEQFVKHFGVPWPCVYAASYTCLKELGAFGRPGDNVRVTPTLYVVRPDGTIAWNDGRARYHHKDRDTAIRELRRAIDEALRTSG